MTQSAKVYDFAEERAKRVKVQQEEARRPQVREQLIGILSDLLREVEKRKMRPTGMLVVLKQPHPDKIGANQYPYICMRMSPAELAEAVTMMRVDLWGR